jgi:UrcA family protein
MIRKHSRYLSAVIGVLAAGTLGLGFAATSSQAQTYGTTTYVYNDDNSVGEVIVQPPAYYPPGYYGERSPLGAPYETAYMSEAVPYYDLDLRTDYGAQQLRARVVQAAYSTCQQLEDMYPIDASGPYSRSCEDRAVDRAMYRVNRAIYAARGYY